MISLDGENKTLDEIIGFYEAQVLKLFYAEYPSTRKLNQRLGVSHTAIANRNWNNMELESSFSHLRWKKKCGWNFLNFSTTYKYWLPINGIVITLLEFPRFQLLLLEQYDEVIVMGNWTSRHNGWNCVFIYHLIHGVLIKSRIDRMIQFDLEVWFRLQGRLIQECVRDEAHLNKDLVKIVLCHLLSFVVVIMKFVDRETGCLRV